MSPQYVLESRRGDISLDYDHDPFSMFIPVLANYLNQIHSNSIDCLKIVTLYFLTENYAFP